MREAMGLDQPFLVRLANWFGNALRGDLGESLFSRKPVVEFLAERIPVTLNVTVLALVVAWTVGISAGVVAALYHGRTADWISMFLALFFLSAPYFWMALNLIFLFSVTLGWLPVGGYVPFRESPREFFRHMVLPCTTLGLVYAGMVARMTRTSMLEVLGADYVRTARAKGLKERSVIYAHALRTALIPMITVMGLGVGELIGGSVVTETVFNIPGLGRLVVDGVLRRDFPVVQGGLLIVALGFLLTTLLVDMLYAWADPRIRYN